MHLLLHLTQFRMTKVRCRQFLRRHLLEGGRYSEYGRPLQYCPGAWVGARAPGANVFAASKDIAVAIDKGDVDGIGHKAGVNREAARKRHDKRQSAGGNRTPSQHAAQTHGKRLRHHKLGRRPAQPVECPRVGDIGRDRGHMTTPGRHGSTVTARSCVSTAGAPSETPAMLSELGHGS